MSFAIASPPATTIAASATAVASATAISSAAATAPPCRIRSGDGRSATRAREGGLTRCACGGICRAGWFCSDGCGSSLPQARRRRLLLRCTGQKLQTHLDSDPIRETESKQNSHIPACICDMWIGNTSPQRPTTSITAWSFGGWRSHRDGDDLLRRPYLWRTHEPCSYLRLSHIEALPLDSEWMSFSKAECKAAEANKSVQRSASAHRSHATEVHNLSERRRRDKINEKMRALQELIPHCNKVACSSSPVHRMRIKQVHPILEGLS